MIRADSMTAFLIDFVAWRNNFAIPQHIYMCHTLQITRSSVHFHSRLSMVNKDMPNRVVMTWNRSPIPSFFRHAVAYLGLVLP